MLIRKLIELIMTFGLPLLLCAGGIYGAFLISPMSDVPSKKSLAMIRGQITLINYEQSGDSPTIQFYVKGNPDPFLIRSDMGYLPLLASRLGRAKLKSQVVAVAYTTSQHNLIQGSMITLNHPWQLDILAPTPPALATAVMNRQAVVDSQLLRYDRMVQLKKDDNEDIHWLGVLALCSGLTSMLVLLYRRRLALEAS